MSEIIDRIGIHKVALTFLEEFNWIEREQSVSDYGIDMHVEIVDEGKPTGQLIALQIKSGESYFKESVEGNFVYRGKERHLDYWQFHSLPVLIVLYNPKENKIYWQKIIHQTIERTEKAWKTLIPKSNVLSFESKAEIEKYYYNINHFITLDVSDDYFGIERRISAKVLVEKTASSKNVMKRMVPFMIEDFKQYSGYTDKLHKVEFVDKPVDKILLFFYGDIQQAKRGLPFCRAFWNLPSCSSKICLENTFYEKDNIQFSWDESYKSLVQVNVENQMNKNEYLKIAQDSYNSMLNISHEIERSIITNEPFERLENTCLKFEKLICKIDRVINFKDKYTPLECLDLDSLLSQSIIHLSNIILSIKDSTREERNKKFMIENSFEHFMKQFKYVEYEYNKVK